MSAITFTIPSRAEAVRWACLAIRGVLEGVVMEEDDMYYVELAVSEAVTNAMRHAYGGSPDYAIGVHMVVEPERLVVEISDTGKPLDVARVEGAGLPEHDSPEAAAGGRGLFLISQAMDETRTERRGDRNVFIMTKRHGGVK